VAGALRELPIAPMFGLFPDETLFEVLLVQSSITERGAHALVSFVPHGDHDDEAAEDLRPVVVPAEWFLSLMPASIFMDIPDDAAAISPFGHAAEAVEAGLLATPSPKDGTNLAARWRANGRPIATTLRFIANCLPLTPPHLVNFAMEAGTALESGSYTRKSREEIATYCELMAHHIAAVSQVD